MDDAALVDVREGEGELEEPGGDARLGKRPPRPPLRAHAAVQVAPLAEGHDEAEVARGAVLERLAVGADVRVVELGEERGLLAAVVALARLGASPVAAARA